MSPELTEKYKEILNSVVNREPVTFKKVFEKVMRIKATDYVAEVKAEMQKNIFNEKKN